MNEKELEIFHKIAEQILILVERNTTLLQINLDLMKKIKDMEMKSK